MTRHPDPSRPRHPRAICLLVLAPLSLAGCMDPLFPEKEDGSQFAGYDRARDRSVPAYVEDEFGHRRPNLRGRLLIHD